MFKVIEVGILWEWESEVFFVCEVFGDYLFVEVFVIFEFFFEEILCESLGFFE